MQVLLNIGEQPRRYGFAFTRQRPLVRTSIATLEQDTAGPGITPTCYIHCYFLLVKTMYKPASTLPSPKVCMHLGGELLPPRRSAQGLQIVYAVVVDFAHDAGTGGHSGGQRFYNVRSNLDAFRLVFPEKPAGGFRIVWPRCSRCSRGAGQSSYMDNSFFSPKSVGTPSTARRSQYASNRSQSFSSGRSVWLTGSRTT